MKRTLIIGGTGTLGKELVTQLSVCRDITVFSRDELKQQQMRVEHPRCSYVVGDVRDRQAVYNVMLRGNFDEVYLVAALKHVDVIEANPVESIKTNILGTINVAEAAMTLHVRHVIFSSTDKAVKPINTYGMCKGIAERYLLSLNGGHTKFSCFRWGNVTGSRGAAIHGFVKSLKRSQSVRLTHREMTRFWIPIADAVYFMINNFETAPIDEVIYPYMKSAKVTDVIRVLANLLFIPQYHTEIVGIRPGEKIHEDMMSSHTSCLNSKNADRFTDEELEDLLEEFV
jgi:UDP-N-acetylglucosamine 4,6-dehydratase